MNSPILSLLWERWRRSRWALIAACLSPLLGPLMYNTGYISLENAIHFTNSFGNVIFLALIISLLLGQCESKNVDVSFPERLFRLPVRTTTLLIVFMGYGIIAVALQYLIVTGMKELFFDRIGDRWTTLLILITIYVTFQTLSWVGWHALVFGLILWVAGIIVLPFLGYRYNPNIICPVIILICFTISFFSMSAYRSGTWLKGFQWFDNFLNLFSRRSSKPFPSSLQAQIWFEMRQIGYIFPLTALCIIGPILGYAVFSGVYQRAFNTQFAHIVPFLFGIVIVVAFIAGMLVYGVFQRDRASRALNFWLRRPMTTRSLAAARQHALIRSVGYIIAIFAVVVLAVIVHDWAKGVLDFKALSPVKWALIYDSPIETVTMTILGLYGFLLLYWILLRMALPVIGVIAAATILALIMKQIIGDLANSLVWNIIIIVLPVSVLIAFYIARRRNLITTATIVYSICMFPLAVISMWAFPWWLTTNESANKGLHNLDRSQIILFIIAAILPFIPAVATPLKMEKLRHR